MTRAGLHLAAAGTALVGAAALLLSPARAATHGDGAALFQARCAACHGLESADHKVGPPLGGILGRRAGAVAGYAYSNALRRARVVWTPRTLDAFLTAPDRVAPGCKMPVSVTDPAVRVAVITYLQAQGAPSVGARKR